MTSVGEVLDKAVDRLETVGIFEARIDAKYLLAEVLNQNPVGLSLISNDQLETDQLIAFNEYIDRRAEREPVAKILQSRGFYGRNFIVSCGTLDPRADSETLIDLALTLPAAESVLDLGTGTGCLLLTYLAERPAATGLGTDLSREAICVAMENASALDLSERARFALGSWVEPINDRTKFDLILCNPPYIRDDEYDDLQPEVRHWDPPLALFAGNDGLKAYSQIFAALPKVSRLGTHLCVEIGIGQGDDVRTLATQAGWTYLKSRNDLNKIERALAFCWNH